MKKIIKLLDVIYQTVLWGTLILSIVEDELIYTIIIMLMIIYEVIKKRGRVL